MIHPVLLGGGFLLRDLVQLKCLFLVVLMALSKGAFAKGFDEDFEEKPWEEVAVQLPPFPEEEDLLPFSVGAVHGTKFLIDAKSLSVGSDGVIRYTLVVISSEGARNVSFEGIRCATSERRFYAFGRADKTWSKAWTNQWGKIRGTSNNHHVELYSNFFCSAGILATGNPDDARRVLRNGGNVRR